MDDDIAEQIKFKGGSELFRELLRLMPLVCMEDYCKNGIWQDELMRMDIQILAAHRLEAGAPDPPDLSEVKLPDAATASPKAMPGLLPGMVRPLGALGVVRPPGSLGAAAPGAGLVVPPVYGQGAEPKAKAAIQAPPLSSGAVMPLAGGSSAVADLRQIAIFASKWGLNPAQAKDQLVHLSPARRRYVMQAFKVAGVEPNTGDAMDESKLEEFIAQCEKTKAWAAAEAAAKAPQAKVLAPSFGAVGATPAAGSPGSSPAALGAALLAGVKRGLDQVRGAGLVAMPPAVKAKTAGMLMPPGTAQAWSPTGGIRPCGGNRPAAISWTPR